MLLQLYAFIQMMAVARAYYNPYWRPYYNYWHDPRMTNLWKQRVAAERDLKESSQKCQASEQRQEERISSLIQHGKDDLDILLQTLSKATVPFSSTSSTVSTSTSTLATLTPVSILTSRVTVSITPTTTSSSITQPPSISIYTTQTSFSPPFNSTHSTTTPVSTTSQTNPVKNQQCKPRFETELFGIDLTTSLERVRTVTVKPPTSSVFTVTEGQKTTSSISTVRTVTLIPSTIQPSTPSIVTLTPSTSVPSVITWTPVIPRTITWTPHTTTTAPSIITFTPKESSKMIVTWTGSSEKVKETITLTPSETSKETVTITPSMPFSHQWIQKHQCDSNRKQFDQLVHDLIPTTKKKITRNSLSSFDLERELFEETPSAPKTIYKTIQPTCNKESSKFTTHSTTSTTTKTVSISTATATSIIERKVTRTINSIYTRSLLLTSSFISTRTRTLPCGNMETITFVVPKKMFASKVTKSVASFVTKTVPLLQTFTSVSKLVCLSTITQPITNTIVTTPPTATPTLSNDNFLKMWNLFSIARRQKEAKIQTEDEGNVRVVKRIVLIPKHKENYSTRRKPQYDEEVQQECNANGKRVFLVKSHTDKMQCENRVEVDENGVSKKQRRCKPLA